MLTAGGHLLVSRIIQNYRYFGLAIDLDRCRNAMGLYKSGLSKNLSLLAMKI
jgi:hypothetical protein